MATDSTNIGNDTTGGGWLDTIKGLATTGAQVYGAVKGNNSNTAPVQQPTLPTAPASNTKLYVIGGVVVAVLVGVLVFLRRK